ncbi:hypothetical protein QCA50_013350 [Cerrena zonata]|uniref:Uncharacterized protein n=1 Tax=Cerrena zonata TaxID=2478898 RepID=A0AAW0FRP7_9APHY
MDAGLPHKRPRRSPSYSSLFGDSSSSDEDEVILTHNRKPIPIQKRESKPIASRPGPKITKPKTHHTTVANAPPVRQRKINLILPTKAKQPTSRKSRPVEIHARDKQKESQQTSQRVSVPSTTHTNVVPVNPAGSEKPAEAELRNGIINIVPVKNDGEPKSWVILTGLKTYSENNYLRCPMNI